MMIDASRIPPNMRVIDETLLYPKYPSGLLENQNPITRYQHSATQEPILRIKDYIYDYNGNSIAPGMYELALSDNKEFLLLIESHNLVAVIPVFKLSQNQSEVERVRQENAEKTKKHKKRKVTNKERIESVVRTKYAEDAITPPQEFVYMNATIEYVEDGGYYLLTYENGMYRAWGAIKVRRVGSKTPINLRN
jgi:hypothetical protein